MSFDGTDFFAIDEEAYAADRPEHTALDHYVRNQLYWLGANGHLASTTFRYDGESRDQYCSVHPVAFVYAPIVLDDQMTEINLSCTVWGESPGDHSANFDSYFELFPFYRKIGDKRTWTGTQQTVRKWSSQTTEAFSGGAMDQMKVPLKMSIPVRGVSLPHLAVVGIGMQRKILDQESGSGVSVNGPPSLTTLGASKTPQTPSALAYDPNDPTQFCDILHYDEDEVYRTHGLDNKTVNSRTLVWVDGGYISPISWAIEPVYDDTYSGPRPYGKGMIRPNTEPEYARGGGAAQRASAQIYPQEITTSNGFQQDELPTVNWQRFPRWRWVDSDEGTPEEVIDIPHRFESTGGAVNSVVNANVMMIGVQRDYYNSVEAATRDGTVSERSVSDTVDIDLEVHDFAGSVKASTSQSEFVSFYPPDPSGNFNFLLQAHAQITADIAGGDVGFPYSEGLLYFGSDQMRNDLDLVAVHRLTLETSEDLSPDDVTRARLRFDLSNATASGLRLYIVGVSISQQMEAP